MKSSFPGSTGNFLFKHPFSVGVAKGAEKVPGGFYAWPEAALQCKISNPGAKQGQTTRKSFHSVLRHEENNKNHRKFFVLFGVWGGVVLFYFKT